MQDNTTELAVIHDSVVKTDKMSENIICRTTLDNIMDKIKICEVKTGFPLIDKANPFKYSVQNAYDGDPATSYVEDSKDDLFEIDMDFMNYQSEYKDSTVTEMKLINGYASNERMYKANNRIKDVQYAWENDSDKVIHSCTDNTMGFQNFYNTDDVKGWVWLEIQSVYKGEKYNNTPLAELDVKWGKNGWLFGTPAK